MDEPLLRRDHVGVMALSLVGAMTLQPEKRPAAPLKAGVSALPGRRRANMNAAASMKRKAAISERT